MKKNLYFNILSLKSVGKSIAMSHNVGGNLLFNLLRSNSIKNLKFIYIILILIIK